MSKIAGRAGHNEKCRGAKGILDEVVEDRKIFSYSKMYLEQKNAFIDCTPCYNPAVQSEDLNYGIKKVNDNNVDLFYSVHLNKAYDKYEGIIGSEVWVYDRNSIKAIEAGKRILMNLDQLGFKNRGIKYMKEENKQLGELIHTKCDALIVECFFLEATKDVEIYNRVGAEAIGFAIANGIDPNINKVEEKKFYVVTKYINQSNYGLEINGLIKKCFMDIDRIYVKSDAKGLWIETQYLAKEKAMVLKDRLDNLFYSVVEE
ncbi:N-acetylmuramoyl-L-alanine amidase [Clostridium sp.]|uniref:N-acetylmuramoyl-L-alanine amidase n=1 Tax=Clostridium sp. TaxID=1506 RepID=UPI002FC8401F